METILIVFVTGALCMGCFFLGAKVGQAVAKGEPIKAPTLNPIKAIREHHDREEAEMEQNRIETIMRNVERYDGTARGQEDVPRG